MLGYTEKQDNLKVRIQAHKKFSNFSLEGWLDERLPLGAGNSILDIGCGNGNLFPLYDKKLGLSGVIVGCDKSKELLFEAKKINTTASVLLLSWDINHPFPFMERSFNFVISTFAIYYVDNAAAAIQEIHRVLKPAGEVFLIGPTDANARELYEFNRMVFSLKEGRDNAVIRRTNRLEKEFWPAVKDVFGSADEFQIPSKLVFPNREEFIKYYLATLLFEESLKKSGKSVSPDYLFSLDFASLEVSKEMIVIHGKKK